VWIEPRRQEAFRGLNQKKTGSKQTKEVTVESSVD
jgi:hypothetical protein